MFYVSEHKRWALLSPDGVAPSRKVGVSASVILLDFMVFSFSGPASWNSLPAELRTISDTSVFKNKLTRTHQEMR